MGDPTLVVTAVDGAASLWRDAPRAMLEAIELQDAAVRAACERCGGEIVRRSASDGFLARFDAPGPALEFCLEVQRALLDVEWPDEILALEAAAPLEADGRRLFRGLRLGIGLHRGPAVERDDGDLFGPAVSRAADLASRAGGGRVLAEASLLEAIGDGVGRHAVELPNGLVSMCPPELAARPTGAPRTARPTNLGAFADEPEIIGRVEELAALQRRFSEGARVVLSTGPGGIGKSRLARRFARLALPDYESDGGVWWCRLEPARSAIDVVRIVGETIGVPLTSDEELDAARTHVGRALADRGPTLLVLDGAERAPEAVAASVAQWRAQGPEARFLITSRARLDGLDAVDLPALDATSSVTLFVRRAEAGGARLDLGGADAAAVAEIARRLEGIPLAIELAAARARLLPPVELAERLVRGLDVLGDPGREGRHGTLSAMVRWSWDLLSEPERDALCQCSVFRGGFTLAAAEAVVRLDGDRVVDALLSLADQSLLQRHTAAEGHLRLSLFEPVREFAAERLEELGLTAEVEDRHTTHYLEAGEETVRGLRGGDEERAVARLAAELDNLVAVCRRQLDDAPDLSIRAALLLDAVADVRGPFDGHLAVLDRAIDAARRVGDDLLEARVRLARGRFLMACSRFPPAHRDAERALSLAESRGDRRVEGLVLSLLTRIHRYAGRVAEARDCGQRAFEALTEVDEVFEASTVQGLLGVIEHGEGDLDRAREHFERALALHAEAGHVRWAAADRANYGLLEIERGEPDRARALLEEGIAIQRRLGDRRRVGIALCILAVLEHEQGDLERARAICDECIGIHRDVGDRRFEGLSTIQKGMVAYEEGDLDEALSLFTRAVDLADQAADAFLSAFATTSSALVHATLGDQDRARAALDATRARLDRGGLSWAKRNVDAFGLLLGLYRPGELPSPDDDGAPRVVTRVVETRVGLRLFRRAVACRMQRAAELGVELDQAESSLEVGPEVQWVRPPRGQRIELGRRHVLRRLVGCLLEGRQRRVGEPVTIEEAVEAAWPGEKIAWRAGQNRVRVAIASLRRMGLRGVLLTRGDGYLLDPDVPLLDSGAE